MFITASLPGASTSRRKTIVRQAISGRARGQAGVCVPHECHTWVSTAGVGAIRMLTGAPGPYPEDLQVNCACAGHKLSLETADWAQEHVARASSGWEGNGFM